MVWGPLAKICDCVIKDYLKICTRMLNFEYKGNLASHSKVCLALSSTYHSFHNFLGDREKCGKIIKAKEGKKWEELSWYGRSLYIVCTVNRLTLQLWGSSGNCKEKWEVLKEESICRAACRA